MSLSSDICAQEPIYIPGAIQPHALLVGLDAKTLGLLTKSANVDALFPETALAAVPVWLPPEVVEACRDLERSGSAERTVLAEIAGIGPAEAHCFAAAGVVFCEFELTTGVPTRPTAADALSKVAGTIGADGRSPRHRRIVGHGDRDGARPFGISKG